jgi:hypothetical protein
MSASHDQSSSRASETEWRALKAETPVEDTERNGLVYRPQSPLGLFRSICSNRAADEAVEGRWKARLFLDDLEEYVERPLEALRSLERLRSSQEILGGGLKLALDEPRADVD